jgi:hypothetical protein
MTELISIHFYDDLPKSSLTFRLRMGRHRIVLVPNGGIQFGADELGFSKNNQKDLTIFARSF